MRTVVLMWVGLSFSALAGERDGSRYYRHGTQVDAQEQYVGRQRYYTQSQYVGGHGDGQSAFQNQWALGRQYQLDAYGRPISGGQMGGAGQAQRGYVHQNQAYKIYDIDQREAAIQQNHRYYLDVTQKSYQSVAEEQMYLARIQNDNSAGAQRRRSMSRLSISTEQTLQRIEARQHAQEMNGTAGWLPKVRD